MQNKIIILSAKRQEAITKVLGAVRTYIQNKKLKLFQICLRNLSKNEFAYGVTTSFNNYQPKEVATDLNSELERINTKNFDLDFKIDEDNENDLSLIELEITEEKQRLLQQKCIRMALQIEFGVFRCSNQPIFKQKSMLMPRDDPSLPAVQQFIKRLTALKNVKAEYEFMGRYGYFVGKDESITFLPDVIQKIEQPKNRKYKQRILQQSNECQLGLSDIVSMTSNGEIVCLTGVDDVPRHKEIMRPRVKMSRKIRMFGEIRTILRHFRTYARKTIAKRRKEMRHVGHIDIRISDDNEQKRHIVQFEFEDMPKTYDLVRELRDSIDYTTIKIDLSDIRFNLREREQLSFLESQFCCVFKMTSQRMAQCVIITKFQKSLTDFLKSYKGLHSFTYEFINRQECQYWKTYLSDRIDKMSKVQEFSFTFGKEQLKITCSSEESQQSIMKSLLKIKDGLVVGRLISNTAAASDLMAFLSSRKQPSVQLKILDIGEHVEMKPSKNIMSMGFVNVHFNLVNYLSAKQSKFIDLSKCLEVKSSIVKSQDSTSENLNTLKKRIYTYFSQGQSFINIVVAEEHYKEAYRLCKGVREMAEGKIIPKNRKLDINFFTQCPESLRIYMWNNIENGQNCYQDKTILLKGLKDEVERLLKTHSSQYSVNLVKVEIRDAEARDKIEAMLPQLNNVVSETPKLSINGGRMSIQSHDKREVSRMLSQMLLYVSGRQHALIN